MKQNKYSFKIIVSLLVLLILFLGFILLKPDQKLALAEHKPQPPQSKVLTPGEINFETEKWTERMREAGANQAYDEFKIAYQDVRFGSQHTMAHIIGAAIYDAAGIEGVQVCDSTFAFGCYHGYFSQALAARGPGVIKQLDDACVAKFGPGGSGCQHGIGHGLMEYYGPQGLTTALTSCKPTTAKSPLAGCISGVFMEYNTPILIRAAQSSTGVRPLDQNHPYDPCPTMSSDYQPSCYYEIPAWWNQVAFNHDYKKLGELCENVPDQIYKETCYLGLGNVVAPGNNFHVEETIQACNQISNKQGQINCLAGASWSFMANPDFISLAGSICEKLSDADKNQCQVKAHVIKSDP